MTHARASRLACGALVVLSGVACSCDEDRASALPAASTTAESTAAAAAAPPELLYLPDGGDRAPNNASGPPPLLGPSAPRAGRCSDDMVNVRGEFCIDRYEAVFVDAAQGREISPYYPPSRRQAKGLYELWQRRRLESGSDEGRRMPLSAPFAWQLSEEFEPRAIARAGVFPNGYMNALLAEQACRNAGKRLCKPEEWVIACRGEKNRRFPYGDEYEQGRCNVFREAHPAFVLHQNSSINHLDPRLNRVAYHGKPLLRRTGETPACQSQWGGDAIHDMVGNLDEWIDDPEGTFLGGFYARNTREGCDSRVSAHGRDYLDYSLGVRCCK